MTYREVRQISGSGDEPEQFSEALRGVAIDGDERLFTVGDNDVKVFDPANGSLLKRWRTAEAGYCVTVDDEGTVYVGETGRVEQFDRSGRLLGTWRDETRLGRVTAIARAGDDVLIADTTHRCIHRYRRDGTFVNDIGKENNTRGFLVPNGHLDFAVDAEGVIHAANPGKHRVERYSVTGELLGRFGHFGMRRPEDFPGCCNPTNLALTVRGDMVVTEKAAPRVKVYDRSGQLMAVIESAAFDPNCKNMDVATDAGGRLYVVDTVRRQIRVFAPETETTQARPTTATGAIEP